MIYPHSLQALKRWFNAQKRDFPWRESPTPYAVWVSEVMLQQTQAVVVIPYFEKWMAAFPTVEALAKAPIDAVIKIWEGLGYYSRARNLHAGANYILQHHKGELPDDADALSKIKGIGPYTVGAILSFAFHKRAAAVDGNVLRVLARYFALSEDISKPRTIAKLRQLAFESLPKEEPWVIAEALIELGATVCTKTPICSDCPMRSSCKAYATGMQKELPVKSPKAKTILLYRGVAVIQHGDNILVKKGAPGNIMQDLYEFPFLEGARNTDWKTLLPKELSLSDFRLTELQQEAQTFTRYRVRLFPHLIRVAQKPSIKGEWVARQQLTSLPFSSGHKRILKQILKS